MTTSAVGFIFAAGRGTRLAPLTDTMPKALVDVVGKPMIDHAIDHVAQAGIDHVIVNVHHFADQLEAHLSGRASQPRITISDERDALLETGGAIVHARQLLPTDGLIVMRNSDVLCDAPIIDLIEHHTTSNADVTLLVSDRPSTRGLLFDDIGLLGRVDDTHDLVHTERESQGTLRRFAFQGIHVWNAERCRAIEGDGAFSIRDPLMDLARRAARVLPLPMGASHRWFDVGDHKKLEIARRGW